MQYYTSSDSKALRLQYLKSCMHTSLASLTLFMLEGCGLQDKHFFMLDMMGVVQFWGSGFWVSVIIGEEIRGAGGT